MKSSSKQSRILTDKERRALYREQRRWNIGFVAVLAICLVACGGFVAISLIGSLSTENGRDNTRLVR
ncbi:MAG: hypothetical protein WAT81_02265 [Candidatus Moraniibacteriota bacterium]